MKKLIVALLIISSSNAFSMDWIMGQRKAIEKGKAFEAIHEIITKINEHEEFQSPQDKWKSFWIMDDMLNRMNFVLNDSNKTGVDRSMFDKWMDVLKKISKKKNLNFNLPNLEETTLSMDKDTVYREYPDYSQKAFMKSKVYKNKLTPEMQKLSSRAKDATLHDDDTIIEASSRTSISEVKSPRSESQPTQATAPVAKKDATLISDGTASDDGSELASELSDDCTLVEQLKRNEREPAVQQLLKNHPILRFAGAATVILIAYKIYLQAQEPKVVIVDSAQNKIKQNVISLKPSHGGNHE